MKAPESDLWKHLEQAWHAGTLKNVEQVPLLLHRLHEICVDVSSWMKNDGMSLTFGDCVKNAAVTTRFSSVLIVPPVPEFAHNGVSPFSMTDSGLPTRSDIDPGEWAEVDLLQRSATHLFLQCAPIMADEFSSIKDQRGHDFFLNGLLPTDDEFDSGLDSSSIISDLSRNSRLPEYEAVKA